MAKIRDDLKGAIHSGGYVLVAGDEVPAGVRVNSKWLTETSTPAEPTRPAEAHAGNPPQTEAPEKPHHAAGVDKWRTYARFAGVDVPDGADKKAIRALVAEAEQNADA